MAHSMMHCKEEIHEASEAALNAKIESFENYTCIYIFLSIHCPINKYTTIYFTLDVSKFKLHIIKIYVRNYLKKKKTGILSRLVAH